MTKFAEFIFLKDDATVAGDISTNTAGASGETSQSKKKSSIVRRLSESTIKFSLEKEQGVVQIAKLKEKYPDAVFTYTVNTDIIGDVSGNGIIEVSDVWYNEIKTIMKDSKWLEITNN